MMWETYQKLFLFFFYLHTAGAICGHTEDVIPVRLSDRPVFVETGSDSPSGDCQWSIRAGSNRSLVRLTFQQFDLEVATLCENEYLLITGGSEDMKFCGRSFPSTIETEIDFTPLKIKYYSNKSRPTSRFKLRIEKIDEVCPGVTFLPVTKIPSYIYSPGYPFDYLPDLNCKWQLNNSNPDEVIILEFVKFDLEGNCIYDNVTIATDKANVTKCGNQDKLVLRYSEPSIGLHFSTDVITELTGFILSFYTVPAYDDSCDTSSQYQVDSSVGRRRVVKVDKTNRKSCSWTIKASEPSHVVVVELLSFYNSPYTCFLKFGISEPYKNGTLSVYNCIDQAVRYYRSASDTIEVRFKDDSVSYYIVDGNLTFIFYSVPKDEFKLEDIAIDDIPSYIYVPGNTGSNSREQPSFVFDSEDTDRGCIEVLVLAANRRNISQLTDYYEFYDGSSSDFGTNIGGPCEGLADTISGTNQYMFVRRKEKVLIGTWLKVQRISSCLGKVIVFDIFSGEKEIKSPNYPERYGRNQVCKWAFKNHYEYNGRVWTLDTIPVPGSGAPFNLCTDTVEISHGVSLKSRKTLSNWCLDSKERYHVTDKYLFLTFRSSNFIHDTGGFRLVANLTDPAIEHCHFSQTVAALDKVKYITSPFYPGHYTNNFQCSQYVVAKEKYHIITINVIAVDLPNIYGNCGDYLAIYDSPTMVHSSLLKKYCRTIFSPDLLLTTGNVARIHFQTNKDTVARGYNLSVKAVDVSGDCNKDFQVELRPKYLSSNNYPTQYNRGFDCVYRINKYYSYSSEFHIAVEMLHYDLPPANRDGSCTTDYLVVYDGREPSLEKHKDTICGSMANTTTSRTFIAVSDSMLIQFITQPTGGFYRGFTLKYYLTPNTEGICSKAAPLILKAQRVTKYITSPNYPTGYSNNEFCQWQIVCTNNQAVKLTILDANLGVANIDGNRDVVRVYDGSTTQASLLGEVRSREEPEFSSSGCSMLVVFSSDGLNSYKGFRAAFTETEYPTEPLSTVNTAPVYTRSGFVFGMAALGLLLVIVVILCCYCRRRRKLRQRNSQRQVFNQVNGPVYNTTTNNVYITTSSSSAYPDMPGSSSARLHSENDLPPPYIAHMLYQPSNTGLPSYEEANMYEIPNTRSPRSSVNDVEDVGERRQIDAGDRRTMAIPTTRGLQPAVNDEEDDRRRRERAISRSLQPAVNDEEDVGGRGRRDRAIPRGLRPSVNCEDAGDGRTNGRATTRGMQASVNEEEGVGYSRQNGRPTLRGFQRSTNNPDDAGDRRGWRDSVDEENDVPERRPIHRPTREDFAIRSTQPTRGLPSTPNDASDVDDRRQNDRPTTRDLQSLVNDENRRQNDSPPVNDGNDVDDRRQNDRPTTGGLRSTINDANDAENRRTMDISTTRGVQSSVNDEDDDAQNRRHNDRASTGGLPSSANDEVNADDRRPSDRPTRKGVTSRQDAPKRESRQSITNSENGRLQNERSTTRSSRSSVTNADDADDRIQNERSAATTRPSVTNSEGVDGKLQNGTRSEDADDGRRSNNRPTREDFVIRQPRPTRAARSISRSGSNEQILTLDPEETTATGIRNPNFETEL